MHPVHHSIALTASLALGVAIPTIARADAAATPDPTIVVTASRRDMIGVAQTASQGTVTRAEVELRPI